MNLKNAMYTHTANVLTALPNFTAAADVPLMRITPPAALQVSIIWDANYIKKRIECAIMLKVAEMCENI